jgi:hypothetical protein
MQKLLLLHTITGFSGSIADNLASTEAWNSRKFIWIDLAWRLLRPFYARPFMVVNG